VVNPGLFQTLAILLARAGEGDNSQPVWATVVIAAGSAVVGALAGGVATYKASSRLEKKLRDARAAIRRKAKIYSPLRSDLRDLLDNLESPNALRRIETEPWPRYRFGGLYFTAWEEMKEDGRALTLGKRPAKAMATVATAIALFNEEFERNQALAVQITRQALDSHPEANHDWQGAPDLRHFIDNSIEPHEVGIVRVAGEPGESRDTRVHGELVALIGSDQRTKGLVEGISKTLDSLKASLGMAITTLEGSMKAIATKYEVPKEED
jgi:hypothetical protein